MTIKKTVPNKKEEKNNSYQDQINLFDKRLQEFKGILTIQPPNPAIVGYFSIDSILQEINPKENDYFFSLSFFYEGLKNIVEIPKGTLSSINFLWWVITCCIKEKCLKSSDDRSYQYLDSLMTKQYRVKIKIIGGQQEIILSLNDYQKNFVRQLPYLMNQGEIQYIKNELDKPKSIISKMTEELNKQEKHIDDKVKEYQRKADDLANFIKEQTTKLNFIGLGSAFQSISNEKRSAKRWIIFFLSLLFLGLLGIPLLTYNKVYCTEQPNYFMAIPFTVVEFILLYVFRLFYQQYLFVKSELLQINLRHNLCAFIEDYMEFKKNNKDNTVDLFEQLIFSNIISDEKKVPATVDGLESIANIIQAIKGK